MLHRFILFCGILFISNLIFAQQFLVTAYEPTDEHVPEVVRGVAQDSVGYLWVASDQGLIRFDGKQFSQAQLHLKSQYIKGFSRNKNGQLFFCNDTGVFELNSTGEKPSVVNVMGKSREEDFVFPNRLFHDCQNRCWVSQPNGNVGLLKNGQLQQIELGKEEMSGDSNSRFSFAEDRFGNIYVGTEKGGIFYFDETTAQFVLKKRVGPVRALQAVGDTLRAGGQALYSFVTDAQGDLSGQETIPTHDFQINCFARDEQGIWFFGTNGDGIFQLEETDSRPEWKQVFSSNDPHRVDELPFRTIHDLSIFSSKNAPGISIWVSSSEGLGLLQTRFFSRVNSLSNDNVFSISPSENGLYISFGTVEQVSFQKGEDWATKSFPRLGRVSSLASIPRGFWAGSPNGELKKVVDGTIVQQQSMAWRGGGIFFIYADSGGSLWFCQAPTDAPIIGVGKLLPNGEAKIYGAEDGLGNRILVVKEGPRGEIYLAGIGTKTYLYKYLPETEAFENWSLTMPFRVSQNFEVHDLAVDAQGMVWLATTDGLLCHDSEHIKRIDLGPYTKGEFRSVISTSDGSLWAATSIHGLLHFDGKEYVLFDESSGLPTTISVYRSMIKDAKGRLWASTAEGLVYSVMSNPLPAASRPPIFTKIDVKKGTVSLDDFQHISLKGNNTINAEYISLAYPGEEILYQYRLENKQSGLMENSVWSVPVNENNLFFEDINTGKYELFVRAQQPGGYAWSKPLTWSFEVKQVWYKTWWAILFFIGFSVFLFWTYARIYVLKLVDQIRSLESLLAAQSKELEEKEALLEEQSKELLEQKEELVEANSSIEMLYLLFREIPNGASWKEIIKKMGKDLATLPDVDAFEFADYSENKLRYNGYSAKEGLFTKREKELDDKTSLTSWSLVRKRPILINDFKKEHVQYVNEKASYFYNSMILFPFSLKNGRRAILNIYSLKKNAFAESELKAIEVLTTYLTLVADGELYEA